MGHSSPESSTAEEESKCVVQVKCSEVKVKVCITISTQVNDLCEKHIYSNSNLLQCTTVCRQ